MNIRCSFTIVAVMSAFTVGCSGTLGKLKPKTGEDRMAAIQELKDNLDDYNVYQCPLISMLDPDTDDKTVEMAGKSCSTGDHQKASEFAEEYPLEDFPVKGLKEILGSDEQFYRYLID